MGNKFYFFGIAFCCIPFLVFAQSKQKRDSLIVADTAFFKHEIVITAQRLPQSNYQLPVVTTIVEGEQRQHRSLRTVPEALFGAAGIFVQKTNHGGGSPFLRGLTGQQTLLLVDGIRLNNATFRSGPNQYLNTIDPGWIERIEVLQSSAAAEYGSDAIGGVVHVVTHSLSFSESSNWRPAAAFKWASGGMETSGQAAILGAGKNWALRVGGAYRHFGDLVAGKGLGKESPSGYTQWSGEAKLKIKLSRHWSLTAAYQDLEQQDVSVYHKVQLENFKYNSFDPQRRQLAYTRLQGDFANRWFQRIECTASRQYSLESRKNQKNNSTSQFTETDKTTTNGLQINVLSNILNQWSMVSGVEMYADEVRSDKVKVDENTQVTTYQRGLYPDRATMRSWAVYNLHTFTQKRWTVTGGLRFNGFQLRIPDETIGTSEIRPSALVGNVGASFELLKGLRVYTNAATAFRAPNTDDLGTLGIVDFRYEVPNTALQSEKSRSYEGGLKIQNKAWRASIGAYHLQLNDLIGRVRTSDSIQGYAVYQKVNITNAYIRGLSAQVAWHPLPQWIVNGQANYTFGENTSAKEPLRRIPPLNGQFSVQYLPTQHWLFRAETVFAGDQRRLSQGDIDDNRIADDGTPGWYVLNAAASFQYKQVSITAEGVNLLNAAYRTHGSGVDGIGRSLWIRVGFGF